MSWLIERFQGAPDRIAFIHEDQIVKYSDVNALVSSFRARVIDAGIKPGATVVVLGDYSPEVFCMLLALFEEGGIVIPLTHNSVIEETAVLGISGCDWHIKFNHTGTNFEISWRGIASDNKILKAFRQTGAPGLVLFSSGSTGTPKGILHDFNKVIEKFRKQRKSVVAIPFLMIDHFGGINTILAITANLGTVVTVSNRSVASVCSAIERHKVELLPTTPSFLTLLMVSKLHHIYDLSSLKLITYGTEVMPQSTLDRVGKAFPNVKLQQTYGLSEVGVLHSQSRSDGSLWVRIGGDGFNTKIIDDVLWIKSNYAMVGYLNAQSNFDSEGWFNTQDKVEVDGDYIRILGRETDLINIGGQKVYPAEVESVILELDNIKDVMVFGENHSLVGQIVVAKVILINPEPIVSVKARVRQNCRSKLALYKVPAKVILVEDDLYNVRQKKIRKS